MGWDGYMVIVMAFHAGRIFAFGEQFAHEDCKTNKADCKTNKEDSSQKACNSESQQSNSSKRGKTLQSSKPAI